MSNVVSLAAKRAAFGDTGKARRSRCIQRCHTATETVKLVPKKANLKTLQQIGVKNTK